MGNQASESVEMASSNRGLELIESAREQKLMDTCPDVVFVDIDGGGGDLRSMLPPELRNPLRSSCTCMRIRRPIRSGQWATGMRKGTISSH